MKKLRSNLLSIALLIGVSMGAAAKAAPPFYPCNVTTRLDLELLCPMGNPVCCKFMVWTRMTDSNEIFQKGQIHPGTYTPFE
jgi:hypothetical protein